MAQIEIPISQELLQFHVVGLQNKQLRTILIDTGSCHSYIGIDLVKTENIQKLEKPFTIKGFRDTTVHTHFISETIKLEHNLTLTIDFLVDFENKHEIIIGVNALDQTNYTIKKDHIEINRVKIPRIRLHAQEMNTEQTTGPLECTPGTPKDKKLIPIKQNLLEDTSYVIATEVEENSRISNVQNNTSGVLNNQTEILAFLHEEFHKTRDEVIKMGKTLEKELGNKIDQSNYNLVLALKATQDKTEENLNKIIEGIRKLLG